MKQLLYEKISSLIALEANKKYTILDYGCGEGKLLSLISNTVSEESTLIGMDASEEVIQKAKINASNINFQQNEFTDELPFSDNYFDLILSVDVLECIPNKKVLVDEIHRILKPSGKVVFAHWDWDTQVYNSIHKETIRDFVHHFSDWQQDWMDSSDGLMGRKLWAQFQTNSKFQGKMHAFNLLETKYKAGYYGYDRLHDLTRLVKNGKIDKQAYDLILNEMTTLNTTKQYFYSVTSFIYYGIKRPEY